MTGTYQFMKPDRELTFPAFFPYLHAGTGARLIKPYLPRIGRGAIADWTVADDFFEDRSAPYGLNSPARLLLLENVKLKDYRYCGAVEIKERRRAAVVIRPYEVIARQEQLADFAFTFDLPILPGNGERERNKRYRLTLANAVWMIENKRRRNLPLFAVVQGWDPESYKRAVRELTAGGFAGFALGGLKKFGADRTMIRKIAEAVKKEIPDLPLHAFGMAPDRARELIDEKMIDSGTATLRTLIETRKEILPADVPRMILRIAEINRTALPLSAYRLMHRQ